MCIICCLLCWLLSLAASSIAIPYRALGSQAYFESRANETVDETCATIWNLNGTGCYCIWSFPKPSYYYNYRLFAGFIPLLIVCLSYYTVRRALNEPSFHHAAGHNRADSINISKRDLRTKRVTKQVYLQTLAYCLSWLPRQTLLLVQMVDSRRTDNDFFL